MDDLLKRDLAREPIPMARCRELIGDEALDLADDEIDAIRSHAHAMAHMLIEIFLQQPIDRTG
jgi:hypothetical protein